MAVYRTILISYFGFLISTLFLKIPLENVLILFSTVLFFGYLVFEFKKLANKQLDGELILRKQTKKIRISFVIFALIVTVGYFLFERFGFMELTIFWSIVVFDIIIKILTKKFKPIALIISGNKLEMNNLSSTHRNLANLKKLKLNGLTDEIELTFDEEKKLHINMGEYNYSDIEKLIEFCIKQSKEELTISDNLKNP